VSNQTDADDDDVYFFLLVLLPYPIPACSIPSTPTAFTSSNRSVKKENYSAAIPDTQAYRTVFFLL